jgi:Domain of unknown function (DUF4249)
MNRVFLIFVLFASFSCTKIIDLNIPDEAPKLVVSAPFSTDSNWRILVGKSGPSIGVVTPVTSISNASISLKENGAPLSGWVIEKELSFGGGWNPTSDTLYFFTLPGIKPNPGSTYQLDVSAANTETVSATASCVSPIPLANIVRTDSATFVDQDFFTECTFEISDPSGSNDFYQLQLQVQDSFTPFPITLSFYSNDLTINEFTDKGAFGPSKNSLGFNLDQPFFSDAFFNGQTKTFKLHYPSFYHNMSISVNLVLIRYSKELFNHERSLRLQEEVGNNPFSEPVRIISNIQGGLGVFGSKAKSSHELVK